MEFLPGILPQAAWLALLSALLFGISALVTRLGLMYCNARFGTLISISGTTGFYWLLSPWLLQPSTWNGPHLWAFVGLFAAIGILSPGISLFLSFEGNRRLGPTPSGTLAATAPIFATLAAIVVLHEWPTPMQTLGTLTIVLGVMVLSIQGKGTRNWPLWAILFPLGAAACRGVVQMGTRYGLSLDPAAFNAALVTFSVSLILHFSITAILRGRNSTPTHPRGILWFLLCGLLNGLALLSLYRALEIGEVVLVSPLISTFPLFTLVLSLVFGIERLGWRMIIAVILIVGGVMAVSGG